MAERIIAGLEEVRRRQALAQALADYDGASFGRLNATAEALREVAKECGWEWRYAPDHVPVVQWVRDYLQPAHRDREGDGG